MLSGDSKIHITAFVQQQQRVTVPPDRIIMAEQQPLRVVWPLLAQILRYNKYPDTGTGTKTLTVKQPDGSKKDFTVDFTKSNYRWNDMRDVYKKGAFSEEEAMAVATLMRDCGFAADMSYASDVSGTPINAAYAGLKRQLQVSFYHATPLPHGLYCQGC